MTENMRVGTAVVMLLSLACVQAFPDGPPESACEDMQPDVSTGAVGLIGHLAEPQNVLPTFGNKKTPPYNIVIHKTEKKYMPGEEIHVSVEANQTTGMVIFKGLLLQARRVVCANDPGLNNETILVEDEPIGTFKQVPNAMLLKTMECGGIPNSAVCHRSPQFKINETVTWIAPDMEYGHVVFRATIVQEAYIYWMSVHSAILEDASLPEGARTCGGVRPELSRLSVLILPLFALVNSRTM